MAKIGLKYMVYNNGINKGIVGKAIKADITIQSNNVELYANDALCETDKSFQSGSITMGTDEMADALHRDLLGHSVDGGGEITANGNDLAPYNSIGFYCVKKVNGVRKFRAIWLLKVQFAEPNDSNQTKNNSPAFSTPEIVGTIMLDDNGDWKNEKTFDLEADAIAYLNEKSGIPVTSSGGLTALAFTGTGGTLSPSFGVNTRYYTFSGLTAASFTVTATAANHTISLFDNDVLVQTLTSGVASSAVAMATVGTKKIKIVAQEAGKSSQITEIIVVKTA